MESEFLTSNPRSFTNECGACNWLPSTIGRQQHLQLSTPTPNIVSMGKCRVGLLSWATLVGSRRDLAKESPSAAWSHCMRSHPRAPQGQGHLNPNPRSHLWSRWKDPRATAWAQPAHRHLSCGHPADHGIHAEPTNGRVVSADFLWQRVGTVDAALSTSCSYFYAFWLVICTYHALFVSTTSVYLTNQWQCWLLYYCVSHLLHLPLVVDQTSTKP